MLIFLVYGKFSSMRILNTVFCTGKGRNSWLFLRKVYCRLFTDKKLQALCKTSLTESIYATLLTKHEAKMTEYWLSSFLHIYSREDVEVNKSAKN